MRTLLRQQRAGLHVQPLVRHCTCRDIELSKTAHAGSQGVSGLLPGRSNVHVRVVHANADMCQSTHNRTQQFIELRQHTRSRVILVGVARKRDRHPDIEPMHREPLLF